MIRILSSFNKDLAGSLSALAAIFFVIFLFLIVLFYSLSLMKKRNFNILKLLGYTKKEQIKIITIETFFFVNVFLSLPFIEMIIFSIKYLFLGIFSFEILILIFMILEYISFYICLNIYKKILSNH